MCFICVLIHHLSEKLDGLTVFYVDNRTQNTCCYFPLMLNNPNSNSQRACPITQWWSMYDMSLFTWYIHRVVWVSSVAWVQHVEQGGGLISNTDCFSHISTRHVFGWITHISPRQTDKWTSTTQLHSVTGPALFTRGIRRSLNQLYTKELTA